MLISVCNIFSLLSVIVSIALTSGYKVVCYYGTWAKYRQGEGTFEAEDIDAQLCTHLIYSFAGLDEQTSRIRLLDPYLDLGHNMIQRTLDLKLINPNLKVLISVGGWDDGSSQYSVMASSENKRKTFIQSVAEFIKKYKFDGLDLDWEYPVTRQGAATDYTTFPVLLKELRQEFDKHGWVLSIGAGVGPSHLTGYNIPELAKSVHFINLMTYDLHGSWDSVTGHHTQMFKMPSDTGPLNLNQSVTAWINGGAPPLKLILGTAFYGKSYTTVNANNDGSLGQPASGKGAAGEFTKQPGRLGFNELCKMLKEDSDWQQSRNQYVQAPWAFKGNQFVAFDDVQSIIDKSEWAKNELGLGGGMTWSVETDDFRGTCFNQKFPLLTALHNTWMGSSQLTTRAPTAQTTERTTTTRRTGTQETTTSSPISGACTLGTYRRDANDCNLFYICGPSLGNNTWVAQRCGVGLFFSMISKTCDYPSNVQATEPNLDVHQLFLQLQI